MEIAEILSQLERPARKFPRAAVEEAVERREEITPELLRILEETIARPSDFSGDAIAHIFAMFLLAQFRESRAYPLFIRIALLPSDVLDELFADLVTESLGRLLASVCGGDIGEIQSLIENENADEYVRGAAVTSLVTLVAAEQKSREEIVSYFARLFQGLLPPRPSNAWNELVACSADLYPEELIDDIEHAYEQDLVDPGFVGLWEIKRDIARGKDNVLARLAENPHRQLVKDTAQEMEWWACFREARPTKEWSPPPAAPLVQPHRSGPKVGRNDPCPCGSGKKYKKCCGA